MSDMLYSAKAIAAHLRIGTREFAHLDRQRAVPTYRDAGKLCASIPALDHYMQTKEGR